MVLAALGARTLGGQMGIDLQTVILASSVLYELTGPACAKLSLYHPDPMGILNCQRGERKRSGDPVQMLIERSARSNRKYQEENISPEEQAFWKLPAKRTKQWGAAQSF